MYVFVYVFVLVKVICITLQSILVHVYICLTRIQTERNISFVFAFLCSDGKGGFTRKQPLKKKYKKKKNCVSQNLKKTLCRQG